MTSSTGNLLNFSASNSNGGAMDNSTASSLLLNELFKQPPSTIMTTTTATTITMTKLTCTVSHTTINGNDASNLIAYDMSGSEIDINSIAQIPASLDGSSKNSKKKSKHKGSNKASASSNKTTTSNRVEVTKVATEEVAVTNEEVVTTERIVEHKKENGSESGILATNNEAGNSVENERNSAVKSVSSENDESGKGKTKQANSISNSKTKASKNPNAKVKSKLIQSSQQVQQAQLFLTSMTTSDPAKSSPTNNGSNKTKNSKKSNKKKKRQAKESNASYSEQQTNTIGGYSLLSEIDNIATRLAGSQNSADSSTKQLSTREALQEAAKNNESLRWNNELENEEDEAHRIKQYKLNRRKRYIEQRNKLLAEYQRQLMSSNTNQNNDGYMLASSNIISLTQLKNASGLNTNFRNSNTKLNSNVYEDEHDDDFGFGNNIDLFYNSSNSNRKRGSHMASSSLTSHENQKGDFSGLKTISEQSNNQDKGSKAYFNDSEGAKTAQNMLDSGISSAFSNA